MDASCAWSVAANCCRPGDAADSFDATGLHITDPTNLRVPNIPIHLDRTARFAKLYRRIDRKSPL